MCCQDSVVQCVRCVTHMRMLQIGLTADVLLYRCSALHISINTSHCASEYNNMQVQALQPAVPIEQAACIMQYMMTTDAVFTVVTTDHEGLCSLKHMHICETVAVRTIAN